MTTAIWFMIGSIVVFNGIAWFMPKHISRQEMIYATFFAIAFQMLVDVYLDVKLDMYGYFKKGVDMESYPTVLGIFPATAIIFYNWYPWGKGFRRGLWYILIWSAWAMVYQELAVWTDMFYRRTWKLWWEMLVNPLLFYILVLGLWYYRRLGKR